MKDPQNGYHISFFKPTTEQARFNRNLVIWLTSIWFIAIFGFQIALRVLEQPTPEPSFIAFENSWEQVKSGGASADDLRSFGAAALSVLGKVAIEEDERALLASSMSWSFFALVPDAQRSSMLEEVASLEALRSGITDITNPEYLEAKRALLRSATPVFGLDLTDPRNELIPVELTTKNIAALSDEAISNLPGIMQKYMVHNQSFLTDAKFLGFPFHYFYSAVFLLILFVGLCWLYCVRADRRNVILGIED
jgi:putative solute:sodium symporter small subunit